MAGWEEHLGYLRLIDFCITGASGGVALPAGLEEHLKINVKRFRGGLVFKAHRLVTNAPPTPPPCSRGRRRRGAAGGVEGAFDGQEFDGQSVYRRVGGGSRGRRRHGAAVGWHRGGLVFKAHRLCV